MKLSNAQKRVMTWLGKGWEGIQTRGSVVEVNGSRICNVDTMCALEKMGLVGKVGQWTWESTAEGKRLTAEMRL